MEFLEQSEKLKLFRKENNFKQSDLASEDITREYISMVEHGKRKIAPKASRIIFENLKTKYPKSIEKLDPEYFSRTASEDFMLFIKKNIKNLHSIEDLYNYLFLSDKFDPNYSAMVINERIGIIFYSFEKSYNQAILYLSKALEIAYKINDMDSILRININLGTIKFHSKDFEMSSHYLKNAIALSNNTYKNYNLLIYNYISSLYELKRYDELLTMLNNKEYVIAKNESYYYQMMLVKALSYRSLKLYSDSIKIFEEISEDPSSTKDLISYSLLNLREIYYILKDMKKMEYYDSKIDQFNALNSINDLPNILSKINILAQEKKYDKIINLIDSLNLNSLNFEERISILEEFLEAKIAIHNFSFASELVNLIKALLDSERYLDVIKLQNKILKLEKNSLDNIFSETLKNYNFNS